MLMADLMKSPAEVPGDTVIRVPPGKVFEAESTRTVETRDSAVYRVVQHLQQHPETPVDIPELARMAGCSRRALEMRFTKVTGMGIAEFYRMQRLENAKKLLRETHLMIYEVASRCGYGSVYHFSNSFRKETGLTPRAYRLRGA